MKSREKRNVMSKWIAIENNLTDGNETAIVGWETEEQEDGITIAVVNHETKSVDYYDEDARTDSYAQEKIMEVLSNVPKTMDKEIIIYNLILMLNDRFDTQDIDNPNFIDYVCENTSLPEAEYRRIMKRLLED